MIDKIDPFSFPACRVSKSLPYGIKYLEKCNPFKKWWSRSSCRGPVGSYRCLRLAAGEQLVE